MTERPKTEEPWWAAEKRREEERSPTWLIALRKGPKALAAWSRNRLAEIASEREAGRAAKLVEHRASKAQRLREYRARRKTER